MPAFSNLGNQPLTRWQNLKPPYIEGALVTTYLATSGLIVRWPQPIRFQRTRPANTGRAVYVNFGNMPLIRWQPYRNDSYGAATFTLDPLLLVIPNPAPLSVTMTLYPQLAAINARTVSITPDLQFSATNPYLTVTMTLHPQLTFYNRGGQPPSCITGSGRLNPAFENFVF
jgi:hypothetical protein